MTRRRITKNYTIQPFQIGPDQREIDVLMINFQAENLSAAQARAMRYAMDDSFMNDIHGLKLIRNNAEIWRWQKGQAPANSS
jgi:ActR/RegA family two-component response regulator